MSNSPTPYRPSWAKLTKFGHAWVVQVPADEAHAVAAVAGPGLPGVTVTLSDGSVVTRELTGRQHARKADGEKVWTYGGREVAAFYLAPKVAPHGSPVATGGSTVTAPTVSADDIATMVAQQVAAVLAAMGATPTPVTPVAPLGSRPAKRAAVRSNPLAVLDQ